MSQKSKKGVKTPEPEMDVVRKRLKAAEGDYEQRQAEAERRADRD